MANFHASAGRCSSIRVCTLSLLRQLCCSQLSPLAPIFSWQYQSASGTFPGWTKYWPLEQDQVWVFSLYTSLQRPGDHYHIPCLSFCILHIFSVFQSLSKIQVLELNHKLRCLLEPGRIQMEGNSTQEELHFSVPCKQQRPRSTKVPLLLTSAMYGDLARSCHFYLFFLALICLPGTPVQC